MLKIDNAVKIFSQGTPNEHKALNSLSQSEKRGVRNYSRFKRSRKIHNVQCNMRKLSFRQRKDRG